MEAKLPPDGEPVPGLTELLLSVAPADAPHVARARHQLRTAAFRLRADCERMVEDLHASVGRDDRYQWRLLATETYVASRALVSAVEPSALARGTMASAAAASDEAMASLLRRIMEGCDGLLRLVPTSPTDEMVHDDARAIRQTAHDVVAAVGRLRGDAPEPAASATAVAPVSKPRILIVDDDAMVREMLRRQLRELGYELLVAEHGRAGLLLAEREQPDLVLTDINMPGLDGITLLRLLKEGARTREIPVVVLSSQSDLDSVVQCIELGAEDHLAKPFKGPLLRARLAAALERKRTRDAELARKRQLDLLIAAAEAVERDAYVVGSLPATVASSASGGGDDLALIARVFDRVVAGLQSREARLQRRLHELSREVGDTTGSHAAAETSSESPFATGELLAGRYEVMGVIGKGGMGMVYHARDREIGEEIAVKVVRRDIVRGDPSIVERLKSEIRLSRRVSHRNVVRVHDLGEVTGTYFITMEYVRGLTVAQMLDRRGRLSIESALAIGVQLAEALAVAHAQQIVHRDIKPANLLVQESGVLKVTDFGIARSIEPDVKGITGAGWIVGTPEYMSPEQLRGHATDGRTDLFALGVVLYECLTGRLPFTGDSPIAILNQIESGTWVQVRDWRPDVPEKLEALVQQQLRPRAIDRAQSAGDLAARLAELEHGAPQ